MEHERACKLVKYLLGTGFLGVIVAGIAWHTESLIVDVLAVIGMIVVIVILHKAVSKSDKRVLDKKTL